MIVRRADNLSAFKCGMSRNAGGLNLLEGLSRPVMELFIQLVKTLVKIQLELLKVIKNDGLIQGNFLTSRALSFLSSFII